MLKWCSRSIFLQVVLGLALGIACGLSFPEVSLQLKPLGDGFIKLIKMLIGLIVFCVVVSGISGAGDLKKVGRIGLKSVIYFEVLTTLALVIGLVFAFTSGIGSGANIHLDQLSTADANGLAERGQHIHGTATFLMDLIPTSVVGAFADNNILQVLLFSVLFGSALADQRTQPRDLPHHGHDRAPGAAGRVRRHRLHHQQIWPGVAAAPGRFGGAVLPDLRRLRADRAGHGDAPFRPEAVATDQVPA
jgi:Na+/H+-dicarboxylate symporter